MIASIVVSCLSEGKSFEARPDVRRRDALAVGRLAGRSNQPGEEMGLARRVKDHGPGPPGMKPEAPFPEGVPEALAVVGGVPCVEGGRPDGGEGDAGPLLDEALLRREGGHGALNVCHSGGLKPVGDVAAPLFAQCLDDAAGMLGRDGRQAEFVLDDSADLLPARIVPTDIHDTAIAPDEAVDPVFVAASVLVVDGPAIGLRSQAELAFEEMPPPRPRAGVVLDAGIGVAVHVIDRLVRPAAEGQGDELPDLADQIGRPKAPRGYDDDLIVFGLGQVPREGVSETLAAHGAGDHVRLLRAFLGGVIVGDGGATMDGPWSPGRPDMNARAAVKRAAVAASEP